MTHQQTAKPKKSGHRALLPVIGLTLAVLLGIVAYVVAPPLVDLGRNQNDNLAQQFSQFDEQYGENALNYVAAGLLWLIMLGLSVFVVALFIGEDPNKESFRYMGPPPSNKKATIKAQKQALKEAQKRAKQKKARK